MKADWQRLKRIALDHPYFDIRGNVLSDAEAESIVRSMRLDAKAFIRNAYADMETDTDPLGIDSCVEQVIAQFKAKPRRERARNTPRSIRRWAIVAAIVLCLTVFFTLTKPGVALANTIYHTIVEIVDGVFQSKQENHAILPEDIDLLPASFSTIESAEQSLDIPLTHFDDATMEFLGIDIMPAGDTMIVIRSRYCSNSNHNQRVLLEQTYSLQDDLSGTSTSVKDSDIVEFVLPDGITCYVGQMDDGTLFGRIFMEDSTFFISSVDYSYDEFVELLKKIEINKP